MSAITANANTRHTLRVSALAFSRGQRKLFRDMHWEMAAGEALLLRGANGSGKTSLIRVLAGLSAPDDGDVFWNDTPWHGFAAERRETALYQGHTNALKGDLTAAENLAELLAFDGVVCEGAIHATALDRAGLVNRHHVLARRLSQGQQRRVGLARLALSHKPLWLLDEPTNALDAEGVALFETLVVHHLAQGGLAVIATHLPMALGPNVRELAIGGA